MWVDYFPLKGYFLVKYLYNILVLSLKAFPLKFPFVLPVFVYFDTILEEEKFTDIKEATQRSDLRFGPTTLRKTKRTYNTELECSKRLPLSRDES